MVRVPAGALGSMNLGATLGMAAARPQRPGPRQRPPNDTRDAFAVKVMGIVRRSGVRRHLECPTRRER